MKQFTREEIIKNFRSKIAKYEPIIAGGAGNGLIAKAEDRAGIDIIMAYNTGPYRMDGHVSATGYRAYSDSNADTLMLGRSMLNDIVMNTPVIGGIGACDPYREIDSMIDEMLDIGFSGVTNVITYGGMIAKDAIFKNYLSHYGMDEPADIELIKKCVKKNVFVMVYAFYEDFLKQSIAAGVDCVCTHVGGTSGGTVGITKTKSIEESCEMANRFFDIAIKENPNIIILAHGGPFEDPESVKQCFDKIPVHGFIAASSIERLPVEKAIFNIVERYRNLRLR